MGVLQADVDGCMDRVCDVDPVAVQHQVFAPLHNLGSHRELPVPLVERHVVFQQKLLFQDPPIHDCVSFADRHLLQAHGRPQARDPVEQGCLVRRALPLCVVARRHPPLEGHIGLWIGHLLHVHVVENSTEREHQILPL